MSQSYVLVVVDSSSDNNVSDRFDSIATTTTCTRSNTTASYGTVR